MKTLRPHLLILLITMIAALVIVEIGPSPRGVVFAQEPIVVLSQSTESVFRKSLTFNIKARSTAGQIISVRLLRRFPNQRSEQVERITDFTPAAEVTLKHIWETEADTIPPWQAISYRWEFLDSAGNLYKTPPATAEFADRSFPWKRLSDGKVAVFYYDQDEKFGQALFLAAQQGYAHIAKATGHTPEYEIRIVIYNDQAAFCTFYAFRGCRDWVGGQTYAGITVQWMNRDRDPDHQRLFKQLVPHELAHAFLGEWLKNALSGVPSWFNEGQAMNNELEGLDKELERARGLASINLLRRLPEMGAPGDITSGDIEEIRNWYAQAASLVAFLYERWGQDSLGKIITKVNAGKRFYEVLEEHTGLTLYEYEAQWRQWLGAAKLAPIPTVVEVTPTVDPFPPTPSG
jgi:plasmid stabilization system protein ParE